MFSVQTLFVTWWASVETKMSSACRLRAVERVFTLPRWLTTSGCFAVCSTWTPTATSHCASRFTLLTRCLSRTSLFDRVHCIVYRLLFVYSFADVLITSAKTFGLAYSGYTVTVLGASKKLSTLSRLILGSVTVQPGQLSLLPSADGKWVPATVRWCSAVVD